jgi:hypothetical protein
MLSNMESQVVLCEILSLPKCQCLHKLSNKQIKMVRKYMYGEQTCWRANNIGQNGLKV